MSSGVPRIAAVFVIGNWRLRIVWQGASIADEIDLSHWIASGGGILAPLSDPMVFAKATASSFGAAVTWDDGEGDLSVDAVHLKKISENKERSGQ